MKHTTIPSALNLHFSIGIDQVKNCNEAYLPGIFRCFFIKCRPVLAVLIGLRSVSHSSVQIRLQVQVGSGEGSGEDEGIYPDGIGWKVTDDG